MTYTNFITIKDLTATSPLWDGEEVIMLGTKISFDGANMINTRPKTFQETTVTTVDIANGDDVATGSYINNFDRRKTNVSYSGFNNQAITVSCVFNNTALGNTTIIGGVTKKIFNPSKVMELVLKPRTVFIKDELITPLLTVVQDTSPLLYSENGIPVVLKSWKFTPNKEGKEIIMDLMFTEDKE